MLRLLTAFPAKNRGRPDPYTRRIYKIVLFTGKNNYVTTQRCVFYRFVK